MKDLENITTDSIYPDYNYVDYYRQTRDSFLKEKFGLDTNIHISDFILAFTINRTAKNGPLVYKILELIPQDLYEIDISHIEIKTKSEKNLVNYVEQIWDLLVVVHNWKSMHLTVNGTEISANAEIRYVIDFLYEKNKKKSVYLDGSIDSVRKKYNKRKKVLLEFNQRKNV